MSLWISFQTRKNAAVLEKRREESEVSLLERCWVPSFSHSSWAVIDHVVGLAAEGVVTTTIGHAC